MDYYIAISTLNDFIFCPYSIYLHNVYMETDEGLYHAVPQTRGRIAHETVDNKKTSNRNDELQALPVISERYGLTGKIDIYRLWFKRKSLVCDLMEPFRCIIDKTIRTAINRRQFSTKDYDVIKGEYRLKREMNKQYSKVFFDALVPYKAEIFKYVQSYYRCFMRRKDTSSYPKFEI